MFSMIVELTNTISSRLVSIKKSHTKRRFFQRPLQNQRTYQSLFNIKRMGLTNVFHGSIVVDPGLLTSSILNTCYPERTSLQSRDGVICRRHGGSSMDQVVITTRKCHSVSCHLIDSLRDPSKLSQNKRNGLRFALFKSLAT